jgi:NADPH-dependent curcumin reductase CurA
MTGLTAYFGMLEIGKPKKGETVVVSGAAGVRPRFPHTLAEEEY